MLFADVTDLYAEEIVDEDFYMIEGVKKPLLKRIEKIYVKGRQNPVELIVRNTHRGPLLETYMDKTSERPFIGLR